MPLGFITSLWPIILKFFTGFNFVPVLQALGASIVKYWQYWLIGTLVCTNILSYHEWQHNAADLKIEKASHAADIASYKKAQADADAKAAAEKKMLLDSSKAKANEADKSYSALYNQYRANLLRFQQTAEGGTSGPTAGEHSDPTQGSDGPGASPIVPQAEGNVTITADDANICAINTARLQTAHDWALQLKESLNVSPK